VAAGTTNKYEKKRKKEKVWEGECRNRTAQDEREGKPEAWWQKRHVFVRKSQFSDPDCLANSAENDRKAQVTPDYEPRVAFPAAAAL
jgi:hypothetical protein